jgi:hypothetical protein
MFPFPQFSSHCQCYLLELLNAPHLFASVLFDQHLTFLADFVQEGFDFLESQW